MWATPSTSRQTLAFPAGIAGSHGGGGEGAAVWSVPPGTARHGKSTGASKDRQTNERVAWIAFMAGPRTSAGKEADGPVDEPMHHARVA